MDATRLYLAECVGVIVLPISRIIIASAHKELNSNKKYQKINVCSIICVMKCLGLCSHCVHIHSELPELPNVTSELVGQCTLWLVWKSVCQT